MASQFDQEVASFEAVLAERSGSVCELCSSTDELKAYGVTPQVNVEIDKCALLCKECRSQIEGSSEFNSKHWFCLNDAAWSPVPAVQALSLRLLDKMNGEDWASSLADQIYMEDDIRSWAEAGFESNIVVIKDSNGAQLASGDTVTIIKDLDVKGTGFVAKRGTVVKNVSLCDDGDHVEGKVNGTSIYIKAEFIKKM